MFSFSHEDDVSGIDGPPFQLHRKEPLYGLADSLPFDRIMLLHIIPPMILLYKVNMSPFQADC